MPKYKVVVREVHSYVLEVEADSPSQARQEAYKIDIDPGKRVLPAPVYEYTMDVEKWRVEDENGDIQIQVDQLVIVRYTVFELNNNGAHLMTITDINIAIMHGQFTNEELTSIVDAVRYKRAQAGRRTINTLKKGDRVQWNGKTGHKTGTVVDIKIKNVIVQTSTMTWKVPATMLTKV